MSRSYAHPSLSQARYNQQTTKISGLDCSDWLSWSKSTPFPFLSTLIDFAIYISTGVLFAYTSAFLVQEISPFAAGSGIPEVKTILGTFLITDEFFKVDLTLMDFYHFLLYVSNALDWLFQWLQDFP